MSRLQSYLDRLPSIAMISATMVIVFMVAGCGGLRPEPEYPAHQWGGTDDVQYFPAGPEFKLPREEAALRAERAAEKARANSVEDSQR
ncbi:hypothetical protein Enr13x_67410 [Stieleria neptunia]|uniref:Lipoprotein n=1 Tax=Stieleria neptunia TaxID=2527979 RepID=A0A518I133_9BACT|nr:hypothetical protein [Stieleria neptunia]QDV46832.1 hypothetical protein Enr13x_67410 [Stieleria neptunia]